MDCHIANSLPLLLPRSLFFSRLSNALLRHISTFESTFDTNLIYTHHKVRFSPGPPVPTPPRPSFSTFSGFTPNELTLDHFPCKVSQKIALHPVRLGCCACIQFPALDIISWLADLLCSRAYRCCSRRGTTTSRTTWPPCFCSVRL